MSAGDRERGLYPKYRVARRDGRPIGATFVLEYDDDAHAQAALRAYIESVREEYPLLARDLDAELERVTA